MTPANAATPGMNPNENRVTVKQGYAGLQDAGVTAARIRLNAIMSKI